MYKSLSVLGLSLCLISSCKCGNNKSVISDQNSSTVIDTSNKPANAPTGADTSANVSKANTSTDTGASANTSTIGESLYRKGAHHARKASKYPGEFPEGSERLLTERDVEFLSQWGIKVMMNEIYARHGMKFSDPMLTQHFTHEGWYHATSGNVNSSLSKVEKENIEFLKNYKFKSGIQ